MSDAECLNISFREIVSIIHPHASLVTQTAVIIILVDADGRLIRSCLRWILRLFALPPRHN